MTPVRPRPVVAATLAVVATAAALALPGCTGEASKPSPTSSASATTAPHSGEYAVATPQPAVTSTPSVTPGGYQLVAAGVPVALRSDGADAVITVAGPEVTLPVPAPGQPVVATQAPGVLTVTVVASEGAVPVRASDFLGLDETQDPYALTPDVTELIATPGSPATLHLASDFASGHTTLTWRRDGAPLITWDFVVEID